MREDLFLNCLTAILIVSDAGEYEETGKSFMKDILLQEGIDESTADQAIYSMAVIYQPVTTAYLACFEEFEAEDEFNAWCEMPESFSEAHTNVENIIREAAQREMQPKN